MVRRWSAGVIVAVILAISAVGCGSSSNVEVSQAVDAASAVAEDSVDIPSQIVRAGEVFTTDTFVGAGWKKSKEYSTETVPGAREIWYGFFNQRDLEIRFFDDHNAALKQGVQVVEAAIIENVKRSRGGELLDISGGSFSAYNAYVVAGNAILLCELDISACEGLVNALE
ncbi:MAG: hypothetical protein HQ478_02645 [Chloroflexi bacterium]|nr:hypothetical protein [Chloroflexota bacterium]